LEGYNNNGRIEAMPMQKRLWSMNGLATELDCNVRTLGRALAGVPADGKLGKHDAWRMATAVAALEKHRGGRAGGAAKGDGDGNIDAICDQIVSLSEELEAGFHRLEAEPDLRKRREMAYEVGPLIGRLDALLPRSTAVEKEFVKLLLSRLIRDLLDLLGYTGVTGLENT
jgi:hypothetical protein